MNFFRIFFAYPILVLFFLKFFELLWAAENVFPLYSRKEKGIPLALKCSAISTVPLALLVLLTTLNKFFKSKGLFSSINAHILQDTAEQNLLFVTNLLASSITQISSDKMLVLTSVYLIGRILYWFGCIFGCYLQCPDLWIPGFLMTFGNSIGLMFFNLRKLVI